MQTIYVRKKRLLMVLILVYVFTDLWGGQSYTIEKSVISNGGGNSSANGYQIQGTIAQVTTGQSSANNYQVNSGYWYQVGSANDVIFKNGFE